MRDVIWSAGIELFARQGFEETTTCEIAEAAGVSRRSFFNYYSSKEDMLVQGMVSLGALLCEAVLACDGGSTPATMVRIAVAHAAGAATREPRTLEILQVATRSASARTALASADAAVHQVVRAAYAKKLPGDSLRAELATAFTLSLVNTVVGAWSKQPKQPIAAVVEQAFARVAELACER